MKKYLILKLILILISLIVFILSVYGLIIYFNNGPFNKEYAKFLYPPFIGVYLSTLFMYFGLYNGYNLVNNLNNDNAFTIFSLKYIKVILISTNVNIFIYLIILPFVYYIAEMDDAPGLILINLMIIFVFFIISVRLIFLNRQIKEVIKDREIEEEL